MEKKEYLKYCLGGLIYTPATDKKIAEKLRSKAIPNLKSLVLCLEDSITDSVLSEAEANTKKILSELKNEPNLPLLFIRVRTPAHLEYMADYLGDDISVLTGFVLPKFDISNLDDYFRITRKINNRSSEPKYIMPILESSLISSCHNRSANLVELKNKMRPMKDLILNIRVGGNDFCNLYGLRRNIDQNIYQIGVVRDILIDILNIFSDEYVVSGPVWEYYDNGTDDAWKRGLEKELELDRLNGFIGKTAIHPSQIPVIAESLKPSKSDFDDAKSVLFWSEELGVKGSADGRRMNEVKTHRKWAKRTFILGELFGIKEEKIEQNLV